MIQSAKANVIRPAVAANDPHALAAQVIRRFQQRPGLRAAAPFTGRFERISCQHGKFATLAHIEPRTTGRLHFRTAVCQTLHALCQRGSSLLRGNMQPQTKFCIILKQAVRPRRAATLFIHRVWTRRRTAPIDGRATRCVGNQQTRTKQLRQQLDIRRFATPGTRAGKFKQRRSGL